MVNFSVQDLFLYLILTVVVGFGLGIGISLASRMFPQTTRQIDK